MIDPMVWDDPDLINLTPAERLLFIALVSLSDDYGHITANPAMLRKWVFGYDDSVTTAHVQVMRDHILAVCHNIHVYSVDGQDYLWLSSWERHQDLRFRGPAAYPCHVCKGYHKNKDDWGTCKDHSVTPELITQDLRSPCVEVTQDLPLRSITLRSDELRSEIHPTGGGAAAPAAPAPKAISPPQSKVPKDEADAKRRAIFMALLNGCGYDRNHLTKTEHGELNAAAKQLFEADYQGTDVDMMAANWCGHFENCTMTPSAIAKHASRLMRPAAPKESREGGQSSREDREIAGKYAQYSG